MKNYPGQSLQCFQRIATKILITLPIEQINSIRTMDLIIVGIMTSTMSLIETISEGITGIMRKETENMSRETS